MCVNVSLRSLSAHGVVGLLTAVAMAITLFALTNEPWWGRPIVPALPLAFFSVFLRIRIIWFWPRRIGNLRDLTVQLLPV